MKWFDWVGGSLLLLYVRSDSIADRLDFSIGKIERLYSFLENQYCWGG